MSQDLLANYKAKHQHPLNRLSHSIGIPMIVGIPMVCNKRFSGC